MLNRQNCGKLDFSRGSHHEQFDAHFTIHTVFENQSKSLILEFCDFYIYLKFFAPSLFLGFFGPTGKARVTR